MADVSASALRDEVRRELRDLKNRRRYFRERIRDIAALGARPSAKESLLAYLQCFVGEPVHTDELLIVSGITEYARRIRELRVEHGYEIISGGPETGIPSHNYVLVSAQPNAEAAAAWRQANDVRRMPGGAKKRILELFQRSIDSPLSLDQLAYVSKTRETGRRIRELRGEDGWRIFTRFTGRQDLRPDQYVMASTERLPPHDRKIPDAVYEAVLDRDIHRCRKCGWTPNDAKMGSRRQFLEVHHRILHSAGGTNDAQNLFTLCNMHHDEVHKMHLTETSFDAWLLSDLKSEQT